MNNQEMLEEISRGLALLALQTAAENLAGLYSKNRLSEDLILPVFRLVFEAPDLRNANADQNNSAHVDLVSDQRKIAVQVTTERTAAKVTSTLTGFLEDELDKKYQRLIFFLLTPNLPTFQKPTRDGWDALCKGRLDFNSSRDIIGPLKLLPLIQALPQAQLEEAYKVIAKSVIGKEFIDVEAQLENFSCRALAYEMNSGKYIPNVFIETRDTKQLARIFCHPVLFLKRHLEEFPKEGIEGWNEFLTKIGQEPLPMPDLASLKNDGTLDAAALISEEIPNLFSDLQKRISDYGDGGKRKIQIESIPVAARPYYEENSWGLTDFLGHGFRHRIDDFVECATLPGKRFFLLTGRAGQGKTNFVCDLTDTFLLRHGVPVALIPVRKLALQQGNSLGARVAELLFDGKIKSFPECAALLAETAKRTGKPFVLILDGLNEHPQGPTFSRELELLLHDLLSYPHLKVLMTCRSEFFQQRFGNLESEALKPYLFIHHAIERDFENEERSDLIDAYFDFFQLRKALVSESVVERLQQDVLLMRFFCEAYGARGKETGYVPPQVRGIYRDEIFELYLSHKLDAIEDAIAINGSSEGAQEAPVRLIRRVLEICLKHMLDEWQFSNIPVNVVPENLSVALERLLEEELIIRRDAPSGGGFFTPKDETLNFTFDEFRDFLLAQYLVQKVFVADRNAFIGYLAKTTPPDAPPLEGLKKFLFYVSRKRGQEGFLEFYVQHQWYTDVFHTEIFNISPDLLTADDEVAVRKRIVQGDWQAQQMAIQLAVNWHREVCPRLNLDLLLRMLADCDDHQFQQIAVASFSERLQFRSGASAEAFADFVTSKVLPDCKFDPNGPEHALFQFLAFLLPVDASPMLESPAYRAMRTALDVNSDYVEEVLLQSLGATFTVHRPFVWRLLSAAERKKHRPRALEVALAQERNVMPPSALAELDRFLEAAEKWTAEVK
jgi:hypothetical protein